MKGFFAVAAAALVAVAQASIAITSFPDAVVAGDSYTITYTTDDLSDEVTVQLRNGDANDLQVVYTITESATGGKFTWDVPADLVDGDDYAIQVIDGEDVNYWGPFEITGGSGKTSSISASSTTSTAYSTPAPSSYSAGNGTASATGTGAGTVTATSTNIPTVTGSPSPSSSAPFEGAAAALYPNIAGFAALFGAVAMFA